MLIDAPGYQCPSLSVKHSADTGYRNLPGGGTERADFTTGKTRQWLQAPTSIGGLPPTDNCTSSLAVAVKAYTLLVETSPWPVQLALNVYGPMPGSGVPSPQSEFPVW